MRRGVTSHSYDRAAAGPRELRIRTVAQPPVPRNCMSGQSACRSCSPTVVQLSPLWRGWPVGEAAAARGSHVALVRGGRTIRNGDSPRGVPVSNAIAVRAGKTTRTRSSCQGCSGAAVRLARRAPELLADRRSLPGWLGAQPPRLDGDLLHALARGPLFRLRRHHDDPGGGLAARSLRPPAADRIGSGGV